MIGETRDVAHRFLAEAPARVSGLLAYARVVGDKAQELVVTLPRRGMSRNGSFERVPS